MKCIKVHHFAAAASQVVCVAEKQKFMLKIVFAWGVYKRGEVKGCEVLL